MSKGHQKGVTLRSSIKLDGHLPSIARAIEEAVEKAQDAKGDTLDMTIRAHAKITVRHLADSEPILKPQVERRGFKVLASYFNLETGVVKIL